MDPNEYTGKEWTDLLKQLDRKQIKRALKGAYRKEANNAVKIARRHLHSSGMQVKGNKADWDKGIRTYVYSRGGGFLVTVKARAKSKRNSKEAGMHANRQYGKPYKRGPLKGVPRKETKKPILMFAEDGTRLRKTRTNTTYWPRKGHSTGQMRKYGFLEKATPEMFRSVEQGLQPELEKAVEKQAKKAGFI